MHISTESPIQPRTWNDTIDNYLKEHDIDCEKATPLKGGASAYIWQLDGFVNNGSTSTCIMKYSDTTFKNIVELESTQERGLYEARGMESKVVAQATRQEPLVQVPRLLRTVSKAVLMNWVGKIDLRKAYLNDKNLDVREIGSRLGRWLASMHLAGINNPEVQGWKNDATDPILEMENKHFRAVLAETKGFDQKAVDRAMAFLSTTGDIQTLVAYDFRPTNALLRCEENSDRPVITVIDWELCLYGDPVYDLKLWVAEALVLETKYGAERGLIASFLKAYRQQAGPEIVTREFVCKLAVLIGSTYLHLMPCSLWDVFTEEEAELFRTIALGFVRAGIDEDLVWLSECCLKPLLDISSSL